MQLPNLAGRAQIAKRYASLLVHFGSEIGERPLVLQTADFFPDVFNKDEGSLRRLVQRLQKHAGIADIPVEVALAGDAGAGPAPGAGCGSGGCSPGAAPSDADEGLPRVMETDEGWRLNVREAELHHPVALTTNLSRALSLIFLLDSAEPENPIEPPLEASADLAGVALGFGVLLLEGSYVYRKSCGGPSVAQLTALSVGELAVACALFAEAGGHRGKKALASLSTTQRALLGEALSWARDNSVVVRQLQSDPAGFADRLGELRDGGGWFSRLLSRERPRDASEVSLELALSGSLSDAELARLGGGANRPRKSPGRSQARAELEALVDEALGNS